MECGSAALRQVGKNGRPGGQKGWRVKKGGRKEKKRKDKYWRKGKSTNCGILSVCISNFISPSQRLNIVKWVFFKTKVIFRPLLHRIFAKKSFPGWGQPPKPPITTSKQIPSWQILGGHYPHHFVVRGHKSLYWALLPTLHRDLPTPFQDLPTAFRRHSDAIWRPPDLLWRTSNILGRLLNTLR